MRIVCMAIPPAALILASGALAVSVETLLYSLRPPTAAREARAGR